MSTETPPRANAVTAAACRVEAYLAECGTTRDSSASVTHVETSRGEVPLLHRDLHLLVSAGTLHRPLNDENRRMADRADDRHRRLRALARDWRSSGVREQGLALDALLDSFEDEESR